MSLTDRERAERDPAAIQRELLDIDRMLVEYQEDLNAKNAAFRMAQAEFKVAEMRTNLMKSRRSGLQSVLKSLV